MGSLQPKYRRFLKQLLHALTEVICDGQADSNPPNNDPGDQDSKKFIRKSDPVGQEDSNV